MPNHVHGNLVFTGEGADDAREGAAGSTQGSGIEVNSLRPATPITSRISPTTYPSHHP